MASEQYIFSSGAGLPSTPIKDAFASVPEVLGSVSRPLVGSNFPGQTLSSGAFSNQTSFFPKSGRWNTFNGQFGHYNNPVSITSNSLQTMHSNTNSSCLQNTIEATLLLSANLEAENYGNNTKGHLMPSFFAEANAQAEAMQLILLNSGYNGYGDTSTPANMVLLGPPAGITVQGNHLYNAGQSQQNYIGITLPSSLSPGSLSPHSSLTSIADVTIPHPCPSSSFPTLGTKNSCNNWKNNELIFTSSGETALPIKLLPNIETNSVTSGHLSMQHVSEYGMQHAAVLSNSSDRQGRLQDAECNQYQIETTCIGASSYGQSLNLSLSSCRPLHNFDSQFEPIVHRTRMSNELEEKGIAGQTVNVVNSEPSHSRTWTRDLVSETSFLDIPPQSNAPSVVVGSFSFLCSSKYLKAAQQLLDEVCSAGRAIRETGFRRQTSYGWAGPNSIDMLPASRESRALQGSSNKDDARFGAAAPNDDCKESSSSMSFEERQDCEMKKAKLLHMLQEVDKRYRQYTDQMQVLISSFDSAVGVGAATPYTALALQAMSRYFRCLRDAICGQLQVVCKTLGEEDIGKYLTNRGNTSRLRYMDQQLRQQRAFQQLNMLQQHAWRPQRGLPERSVSILRAWLFEHFLHPYPKDADKMMLARQTGLTRSQVSNWFINARVRLWKPMVEEMYQEESREQGIETSVRLSDEADGSVKFEGGNVEAGFKEKYFKMENSMHRTYSNTEVSMHTQGTSERQNFMDANVLPANFLPTNYIVSMKQHALGTMADMPNFHMLEDGPKERHGLSQNKKSKVDIDEPDILLSNMRMQLDTKSDETSSNAICDTNENFGSGLGNATEQYSFSRNGSIQADVGCYGSYCQQDNLNKYGGSGGFDSRRQGSGVSLTLGLRHCDSLPAAQQTFVHATHNFSVESRQNIDGHNKEYNTFYGAGRLNNDHVNDSISVTYQTRKHIEGHMLHDFVIS